MRAKLEVRQHAQFFERANRQVLRFVDDQQAAPTGARFLVQKALDRAQCRRLVMPFDQQTEGLRHDMDQLFAIELAGHHLRGGKPGRIDGRHQMRDESRFACANLASNDDKAFALRQAIAQIGQRLAMRQAFEIESRIGCQLERTALQPIEIIEHNLPPLGLKAVTQTDQCIERGLVGQWIAAADIIEASRRGCLQMIGQVAIVGKRCTQSR